MVFLFDFWDLFADEFWRLTCFVLGLLNCEKRRKNSKTSGSLHERIKNERIYRCIIKLIETIETKLEQILKWTGKEETIEGLSAKQGCAHFSAKAMSFVSHIS